MDKKLKPRKRKFNALKKMLFVFLFLVIGVVIFLSVETNVTENLDSYVYDLPFAEGAKYKIVQGYGGLFSHRNKAALDFSMPEGTPIHAARGGVVYSYKDDSNEGGLTGNKKANYIMIRHSDGSIGCYWHLKQNGVAVKRGKVEKGQLIGYSGSTGFVLRPHLHFAVKRVLNYQKDSFVRTKFRTSKGVEMLKRGRKYSHPGS